ncbi:MAG: hypothetical protein ACREPR_16850 [Brasilonema sp.]
MQKAGYNVAFLGLAAIAAVATIIFWMFVPETKASHKAQAFVSNHYS